MFTSKQSQLGPLKLRAMSLPKLTGCDTTSKFSGVAIQRPGMYVYDGGIVVVVSDGGIVVVVSDGGIVMVVSDGGV